MNADTDRLRAGDQARMVQIPTGTAAMDAELVVPPNAEGLVVFVSEEEGARRSDSSQRLARALWEQRLGTLQLDLLSPAEAAEDAADHHLRFNIGLLTQRLVCATQWVVEEDEARHLRLGFLGFGTGAGVALVAAADLGRTVGAVVSRGGRPDLAGNALRRTKVPTLLIVGEKDEPGIEVNEDAYEMLDGPKALTIVQDAGADFDEAGALEKVARLASGWFLQYLRPAGGSRLAAR